jgi:hypothetical protein
MRGIIATAALLAGVQAAVDPIVIKVRRRVAGMTLVANNTHRAKSSS